MAARFPSLFLVCIDRVLHILHRWTMYIKNHPELPKFPQSNLLGKALFRIPPIPIAFQGGIGNRKRLHEIDAGTRYC